MFKVYQKPFLWGLLFSVSIQLRAETGYQLPDSVRSMISAIPLSEIASTAATDIRESTDLLTKNIQIDVLSDLRPVIDTISIEAEELRSLSNQLLEENLPFDFYNSLITRWSRISSEIVDPAKVLTDYSSSQEGFLLQFRKTRYKWQLTGKLTENENLTNDILDRIESVLHFIDSATFIIKDSLNASIELQNQTTDLKILADEYLNNIQELQQTQLGSLLIHQGDAIWSVQSETDSTSREKSKAVLVNLGLEDSRMYLKDHWDTIVWLIISFFLLLLFLLWLKKSYASIDKPQNIEHEAIGYIISWPAISAYLFTVLFAIWWLPVRPLLLSQISAAIYLVPFLVVFYRLVLRDLRWCIFYFTFLYLFNGSRGFYQFNPFVERIIILLESVLAGAYLLYFFLHRQKISLNSYSDSLLFRFLNFISPVFFFILLISAFSNVFGYYYLSEVINAGVLLSLVMAMVMGIAYVFIVATLYSFIQTAAAHKSYLIKEKKDNIYRWLKRYIRLTTIIIWIIFSLRGLFLWEPVKAAWLSFWNAGYNIGELSLTIGNIFTFALIVYLSWLVSYIIKLLLEVEIFGRLNMPRGVPMAISSLTQYFLIILGFIMALSLVGFDLKNLSILAGALGVGIGFGLQHTVNNFISGLILAFERPVTVGDIVNVAGHEGTVIKIGIRASTIKQWDGSQVIVPNAELISSKVINWTLSKYERRFILTIHTNLKTDAEKVLKLMKEAGESVEYVLKNPEAKSYFHGIKDKYMEFALFYWTSENILDCKSLVNLAVQKALAKEGIDFIMPVPLVIQEKTEKGKTGKTRNQNTQQKQ